MSGARFISLDLYRAMVSLSTERHCSSSRLELPLQSKPGGAAISNDRNSSVLELRLFLYRYVVVRGGLSDDLHT